LQYLLQEYSAAKLQQQPQQQPQSPTGHSSSTLDAQQVEEQRAKLKQQVTVLEEKNEILQAKVDALLTDKTELSEKHAQSMQTGAAASSRLHTMSRELEALREEKQQAQFEIKTLTDNVKDLKTSLTSNSNEEKEVDTSSSSSQAQLTLERDAERDRSAELQEQLMNAQMEVVELKDQLQMQKASAELQQQQSQRLSQRLDSQAVSDAEVKELRQQLTVAEKEILELKNNSSGNSDSDSSDPLQLPAVVAHIEQLKADMLDEKLGALEEVKKNAAAEKAALEAAVSTTAEHLMTQQSTIAGLEEKLAAAAGQSPDASSFGTADEERTAMLKEVMQEIYSKACEVFDDADNDGGGGGGGGVVQYESKDLLKRLRAILKHVTNTRCT